VRQALERPSIVRSSPRSIRRVEAPLSADRGDEIQVEPMRQQQDVTEQIRGFVCQLDLGARPLAAALPAAMGVP
jgi:hypothetical protein